MIDRTERFGCSVARSDTVAFVGVDEGVKEGMFWSTRRFSKPSNAKRYFGAS